MLHQQHQARQGETLSYNAALQLVLKAICIELCRLSTSRHVRSETKHANRIEKLISEIDAIENHRQCIQWTIQNEGRSKEVGTDRLNKLDTHAMRIIHSIIHPMHPDQPRHIVGALIKSAGSNSTILTIEIDPAEQLMLCSPKDMMLHQTAETMLETKRRLPILPKLFAEFLADRSPERPLDNPRC